MRLEIRERPYDLYAVIAASVALMLVLLLIPDITTLRVILGLPFILFFPGYALISALYPEKKKVIGEYPALEDEDHGPDEKTKAEKREERRKRSQSRRKEQSGGDSGEEEEEPPETKGLDGLERVALSLGLSIAITPLIGLILNYTYDWDPEHLGIRLIPIFVSQFAFITATSIVAIYRRQRVPLEDRFEIVIDISIPEDYSTTDKILTVGIAIMMVLSVGLLIYIIVVPREGESFTEFYVLGSGGMADDYPRYFKVDVPQSIYIGIGNHEHRDMNYTLFMTIDQQAENSTVESMDNVSISRDSQPLMEIGVKDGETVEIPCNFTVTDVGSYKLRLLLYHDGEEYRDLHLWVKAFSDGIFRSVEEGSTYVYLAGPHGDPSRILEDRPGGLRGLSISVVSDGDPDHEVQISVAADRNGVLEDMKRAGHVIDDFQYDQWYGNVSETEGSKTSLRVNDTEVGKTFLLDITPTVEEIHISVVSTEWSVEFSVDNRAGV